MTRPLLVLLTLSASAACCADTCIVRPAPGCDLPKDFVHYTKTCPDEPTTSGESTFICVDAPPRAEVTCQSANGLVECEAWPQSPDLTYRYIYTVLSGIESNYSADEDSPMLLGNCTGEAGRVSVTVIAPNGVASSARGVFACLHDE